MITDLHNIWGVAQYATQPQFTCYESVQDKLNAFTKEHYLKDPEGIVQQVFDIYRSINITPIVYYTESGLITAIKDLSETVTNSVKNNIISLGNNQGQGINRFLFPNMMTAEPKGRGSNSLKDRFLSDAKLKRALELVTGENVQNFKSLNARAIVEHLCPVLWGNVYDYSAGYGGRMLGITTSNMRYNYQCIDPNTETVQHLTYLSELIEQAVGNKGSITQSVSEEYEPMDIDLAFSSPPYFNLEKYSDEPTQCMVRYTTLDEWFDGYVVPTMKNIHKGLNSDGVFATNIADYKSYGNKEYAVCERWIATAEKLGFIHQGTIKMMLNTRPGVGNDKVAGREKFEGVYVFTK
jgi:hypothetical protein